MTIGAGADPVPTDADVIDLTVIITGLDAPPRPDLDPFLNAAATCFARHGLKRTSVQDVARELGVDRTTVYRQVGTIPQLARLLAARELQQLVTSIPRRASLPVGPEGVVEIMASVIEDVRSHPVMAKFLADDTDTVSLSTVAGLPPLLKKVAEFLAPLLSSSMAAGTLTRRDPVVLAEWLIRLVVTLVLVPPLGELRPFLSELLVPALTP